MLAARTDFLPKSILFEHGIDCLKIHLVTHINTPAISLIGEDEGPGDAHHRNSVVVFISMHNNEAPAKSQTGIKQSLVEFCLVLAGVRQPALQFFLVVGPSIGFNRKAWLWGLAVVVDFDQRASLLA